MPAFEENPNDLRETLEAAVTASEGTKDDPVPERPPGPEESAPPAPEVAPIAAPADAPATPVADAAVPAPEVTKPEIPPAPPPEIGEPSLKAPGTWTPGAREKWATLPKEVREEVWKREKDASRALTTSSEARKFQNEFSALIQPYLRFIAAEQSTPLAAVNNMMQTAAALRVGTPVQKVEIVASIIKNFGIDLHALDSMLAGQKPEINPQAQVQQLVQEQLAPVRQLLQQHQQNQLQAERAIEHEVQNELEQFASDPKHEFYWDVKDTMTDIMELAARRGQQMGLTEAYERATLIHEPVRRVIDARKLRDTAQSSTQAAQRARGTAASVVPSSEADRVKSVPGDSIRASIEAAIDAQQGR
jgi:hypothetical protein